MVVQPTKCKKCKEPKDFYCFAKRKDSVNGYRNICKVCTKEYNKEYYKANRERIIKQNYEYKKKRMDTDISFLVAERLRSRLYKAVRYRYKNGSAVRDLGCTIEFLIQNLEEKFTHRMSWVNYGKWHIDHIVPLSSFDLTKREQVKIACHYTNLQPLWAQDNLSKGSKIPTKGDKK